MSFVSVRIRHLDQQLERLIPSAAPSPTFPGTPSSLFTREAPLRTQAGVESEYVKRLQTAIQTIDNYGSGSGRIQSDTLLSILGKAKLIPEDEEEVLAAGGSDLVVRTALEQELEWAFLGKMVIHTYGLVLETLLSQTLPLSEDLRYWEEVRASYYWTMMYWVQTSPVRLVGYAREVVGESLRRVRELGQHGGLSGVLGGEDQDVKGLDLEAQDGEVEAFKEEKRGLVEELKRFYGLVRATVEERSRKFQHSVLIQTPVALARREIGNKRGCIKDLRETQAAALGILVGEGLVFDGSGGTQDDWKEMVRKSVDMMDNITRCASMENATVSDFELYAFSPNQLTISTKGIELVERKDLQASLALSLQLRDILQRQLPAQARSAASVVSTHGRPSWLIRNWIPITTTLLSSSTILKYIFNRKAELRQWLTEMGATILDFWCNWVVDPLKRIIGTIRHDKSSEVALMSRRSLTADMESLERMVVDFAIDNPTVSLPSGEPPVSTLTPSQLDLIRRHVKEGDLTPVLRAYEQDLKTPLLGALRGELIRALLIQIQKTKVDVEVAIHGIDSLLKSQELLFGILGLMPSTLLCVGTLRWFRGTWGGRRGLRSSKLSQEMLRSLRRIDRILGEADAEANAGLLPFKDHGLVLCEVYLLQEYGKSVLPRDVAQDFTQDMEDLVDIRKGIRTQRRILKRVRWAFGRWIH